jgi:hypothetical protein
MAMVRRRSTVRFRKGTPQLKAIFRNYTLLPDAAFARIKLAGMGAKWFMGGGALVAREPTPAAYGPGSGLFGRVPAMWLPLCGGLGVADRQADGPVAEVGDEVQAPAEGLDVTGDDLERSDLAVLDLGHPGDAHAHVGGDLLLAQAQLQHEGEALGGGQLVQHHQQRPVARAPQLDMALLGSVLSRR